MSENSWVVTVLGLSGAILLEVILFRISRDLTAGKLQDYGLQPITFRGQTVILLTVILRGPVYLQRKLIKLFELRRIQQLSVHAPVIAIVTATVGVLMIGVGQTQRTTLSSPGSTSLFLLGIGLALLTASAGIQKRFPSSLAFQALKTEIPPLTEGEPRDASRLYWMSPARALIIAGSLLALLGIQLNLPIRFPQGWFRFGVLEIIIGGCWLVWAQAFSRLRAFAEAVLFPLNLALDRVIFLLNGILLSFVTIKLAGTQQLMVHPTAAILAWLVGIILVVLGAWRPQFAGHAIAREIPWKVFAAGIALALLSIPLRAIGTEVLPLGFTGDEGSMGANAVQFLTGSVNNIFITGWFGFPNLFFFIQSGFIAIFGQTAEAVRFSAVFAGAAGIAVTYWVARALFGTRIALLSGLFLVFFHFHIHFSRLGLNNIWDSLIFIWVLGALWVGWARRSRGAYVLAGLGLGVSIYFYASARVLFLLVPLLELFFCWVGRRRIFPHIINLVVLLCVAVSVALPLGIYFAQAPEKFMEPLNRVSIFGNWMLHETHITTKSEFQILVNQLVSSARAFTDLPTNPFYAPGTPLLLAIPAILFWIAVAAGLAHWRDSRTWLVAGWLGVSVLAGAMSVSTPAGHRYIATAPVLAMMVGFGLSCLMDLFEKIFARKQAGLLLAFVLLPVIGWHEIHTYLSYAATPSFGGGGNMIAQVLADVLLDEPDVRQVYFFEDSSMVYPFPQLDYLAPKVQADAIRTGIDWQTATVKKPIDPNCLFVFLKDRQDQISTVLADYPGGRMSAAYDPDGSFLFWLYDPFPPFSQPDRIGMKTFAWPGQ